MRVLSYGDLKNKGIRFSRQWIAKLIGAGKFPRPIQLGEQSVGFIETEVDEWIAARIRDRDQAARVEAASPQKNTQRSVAPSRRRALIERTG
jgi:prophage regulatory protein